MAQSRKATNNSGAVAVRYQPSTARVDFDCGSNNMSQLSLLRRTGLQGRSRRGGRDCKGGRGPNHVGASALMYTQARIRGSQRRSEVSVEPRCVAALAQTVGFSEIRPCHGARLCADQLHPSGCFFLLTFKGESFKSARQKDFRSPFGFFAQLLPTQHQEHTSFPCKDCFPRCQDSPPEVRGEQGIFMGPSQTLQLAWECRSQFAKGFHQAKGRSCRRFNGKPRGCGSKPMVPFWGRCTTHFSLF